MADNVSIAIFLLTLTATFAAAYVGRRHAGDRELGALSNQKLNKWLIGLSAGATANSGFVVTGAVGLGYSYGAQWLLLPLAWLVGDIVFWSVFPERINRTGREAKAATLTDVLVFGLENRAQKALKVVIGLVIICCLSGYLSAQWLAGQKFLQGAFGFADVVSLLIFAAVIVAYTTIGGFRGSVYADSLQAIIRIIATAIALIAVVVVAHQTAAFWNTIGAAGPDFFNILPNNSFALGIVFIIGFASAALGFGLGQPQLVSRYLAGESPAETKAAWTIYIMFVQATWLAMTAFGMILRGILPDLHDPETGLSAFFRTAMGPVLTGIIVADIFATISATSNSILVAMAQTISFDLLSKTVRGRVPLQLIIATVGVATMALSVAVSGSVVSLALSSVSLMGAGLAPPMIVRLLDWRHTALSLIISMVMGILVATIWKFSGLSSTLNEAAPGIGAGLISHYLAAAFLVRRFRKR